MHLVLHLRGGQLDSRRSLRCTWCCICHAENRGDLGDGVAWLHQREGRRALAPNRGTLTACRGWAPQGHGVLCVRCGGRWHLGGSSQLATCSPQNYLGVREVLRDDRSLGSSLEDRRDRSPQPLQQCPDAHSLRALEDRRVARRACSTHGVAAHTLTLATRLN